jgi:hypothetical protein
MLLSVYSLLPESLRFSRGILVFGTLLAFLFMTLMRLLLIKWKVIEEINEGDEHRKTIVAGTKKEYDTVNNLMHSAGMSERILGRIEVENLNNNDAIANLSGTNEILKKYSIREIIFCEGTLSFKKIIEQITNSQEHVRIKLYTTCSQIIIGSGDKNASGKIISPQKILQLSIAVNRRNKNLIDILISLFFIITFPVHFLLQKKSLHFFKNVFDVLLYKKMWVGYAAYNKNYPVLKPGILTSTGLPAVMNTLPPQSLQASDEWYASDYDVWQDFKIIWRGYKYLST